MTFKSMYIYNHNFLVNVMSKDSEKSLQHKKMSKKMNDASLNDK